MLTNPSCPKKPKRKEIKAQKTPKNRNWKPKRPWTQTITMQFNTISYVHAPNTVKRYSELRKTIPMSHRAPQLYWVLPAAHMFPVFLFMAVFLTTTTTTTTVAYRSVCHRKCTEWSRHGGAGEFSGREGIFPFDKWLITMVSKSPNWGYSPSKWSKWLINGGY